MTNRLKALLEEPEEREPEQDYFEIRADCEIFYVEPSTAREIGRQLERRWPPRWLRFRDLTGAEIRVRSALVDSITECTGAQRAAERNFRRARRLEEKADRRPWEEDDW